MMRHLLRQRRDLNVWPGWVDGLSSMIMVVIFVLLFFVLSYFIMQNQLFGQDQALTQLQRVIVGLRRDLGLAETENTALGTQVADLSTQLQETQETLQVATAEIEMLDTRSERLSRLLSNQTNRANRETASLQSLQQNLQAMREDLGLIQTALDVTEGEVAAREQVIAEKDQAIADLSEQLNTVLASKVQELNRYRSEFFGRLRDVLSARDDIEVTGDRFVFQSEILFASGSATLEAAGRERLRDIAETLRDVAANIPDDIPWLLRVDGHTDVVPIDTPQFPSNWELSQARALSVVQFFVANGFPSDRLAAAGFGPFQPVDSANTPEAHRKNRRIELRLDQR